MDSVNDGRLVLTAPEEEGALDSYKVDLTTTTGRASRWDNGVGQGALNYGDMTNNDRKALTYTTDPLEHDLTVTGHPIASLYISASVEDCDFHVLLEEVDDEGVSTYVSEAVLRASRRELSDAPWNNLGLPYQRCHDADHQSLVPGEVTELKMDLHPVAVVFNKAHRIRVTIMCADKDNTQPLPNVDGAEIKLHHNPTFLSNIALPIESDK